MYTYIYNYIHCTFYTSSEYLEYVSRICIKIITYGISRYRSRFSRSKSFCRIYFDISIYVDRESEDTRSRSNDRSWNENRKFVRTEVTCISEALLEIRSDSLCCGVCAPSPCPLTIPFGPVGPGPQRGCQMAAPCRYISSPSPNGSPHFVQRAQVG